MSHRHTLPRRMAAAFVAGVLLVLVAAVILRLANADTAAYSILAAIAATACLAVGLGGIEAVRQRIAGRGADSAAEPPEGPPTERVAVNLKAQATSQAVARLAAHLNLLQTKHAVEAVRTEEALQEALQAAEKLLIVGALPPEREPGPQQAPVAANITEEAVERVQDAVRAFTQGYLTGDAVEQKIDSILRSPEAWKPPAKVQPKPRSDTGHAPSGRDTGRPRSVGGAKLVAIGYPDQDTAERALQTVQQLETDLVLPADQVAAISRDIEGKYHVHTTHGRASAGGGAAWGGFWGLLFGVLFFIPFAGLALSAGMGALIGHLGAKGIDQAFQQQVRDYVKPGTSALFMVIENAPADKAIAALAQYGGTVIRTSIPEEEFASIREKLARPSPATRS